MILHAYSITEPCVNAGAYAKEDDACGTDSQRKARVAVALERRKRGLSLLDVHGLHDEQIVVE